MPEPPVINWSEPSQDFETEVVSARQNASDQKRINRWLWLILGGSVLLRLSVVLFMGNAIAPLPGIYDQISYHTLAGRVLHGFGFSFETQWWPLTRAGEPTAHWSFLYTLFLTSIYSIFGVYPVAARVIQAIIVGLATPWLVFRLSREVFQLLPSAARSHISVPMISLLAAAWTAVYGYFIYYAAALMTESFFIVCVLWSIDCAIRVLNQGKLTGFFELGLAMGIAILLRQTFLFMLPFILLWLVWATYHRRRKNLSLQNFVLGSLGVLLVISLMIGPFSYYNFRRFGHFVLLNTNSGYAFFWSNHPIHGVKFVPLFTSDMPTYQALIPTELRHLDEAELDQALLKLGIKFVLDDPVRFFLLSLDRIPIHFQFWPTAGSGVTSNVNRVISLGFALPFMLVGGWMWFQDIRRRQILPEAGILLVIFILVFSLLHITSWASVRYRLPTDAVALVFAARSLSFLLIRLRPSLQNAFLTN